MSFMGFGMSVTWLAKWELKTLKNYAQEMEVFIGRARDQFEADVDAAASKIAGEDERDAYYDHQSETWSELKEDFPRTLRYALLVATYSQLEHFLVDYCNRSDHPLRLKDIRGEGIGACQTYIKRVLGRPFPDQTEYWARLNYYRKLRNLIVHSDGQTPTRGNSKSEDTLLAEIEGDTHAAIAPSGRIELRPTFALQAIKTVLSFLEEFQTALEPVAESA